MKTGELAFLLGISDQTIVSWTNLPDVQKFLSPEATGAGGNIQRIFTESDVVVLNSIRSLRAKGRPDWKDVIATLEQGWRDRNFPQHAAARDVRTVPVPQAMQAAELAAMTRERDSALAQLDDLRQQINEARQETNRVREMLGNKIEKLLREVGKLEGMIEILREQQQNKAD